MKPTLFLIGMGKCLTLRPTLHPAVVGVVVKDSANSASGVGSVAGSVKADTVSPTARHCCDLSSKLIRSGTQPRG